MGGFFGVASNEDCVFDLFFGIDYHSHLGTRRGGMTVLGEGGFQRAIHNIENAPFRTKFDKDVLDMKGKIGIGCISDYEAQPLIVRSHHGTYSITTVGKINNLDELVQLLFDSGHVHFQEMSTGEINATELIAATAAELEESEDIDSTARIMIADDLISGNRRPVKKRPSMDEDELDDEDDFRPKRPKKHKVEEDSEEYKEIEPPGFGGEWE